MIGKPIEGIRAAGSKDDANCAASSIRDRGDGCRALDVGYSCRLRSPLGPGYVVVGRSISAWLPTTPSSGCCTTALSRSGVGRMVGAPSDFARVTVEGVTHEYRKLRSWSPPTGG